MAPITDADQRADARALFDIDSGLTRLYVELYPKADQCRDWARDLRGRAAALGVLEDFCPTTVWSPCRKAR